MTSLANQPIATEEKAPQPRQLWLNRDYMLLWNGQTISAIGTQISGIALPLLILALTHSPAIAGFAGALRALPYIFFSLPVGALIDRWNRKLVMILCDSGRAALLGSIPIALALGSLTTVQIYLVAIFEGTLFVFFDLAEAACLPRVVSKEQLPAATAQNQATMGISTLAGPPLGGLLYGISQTLPFIGDAVSYLASVLSLFLIKARFQGERSMQRRHLLAEIGEGLRWLWSHPLIRYMAFLTGMLNLIGSGSFLIIIVIAQHQGANPAEIGLISTIAAVGGIIGSVIGGFIQRHFTFGQVIITTVWIQTLSWPLLAVAPGFILLGVVSAIIFMVVPIYNVVQFSYRIALIPDELQGRVNSTFRLLAFGFQPIGFALTGILLEVVGAVQTVLIFFAFLIVVAGITHASSLVRDAQHIQKLA
jgi:predicted MFS family arabinose efflux permease